MQNHPPCPKVETSGPGPSAIPRVKITARSKLQHALSDLHFSSSSHFPVSVLPGSTITLSARALLTFGLYRLVPTFVEKLIILRIGIPSLIHSIRPLHPYVEPPFLLLTHHPGYQSTPYQTRSTPLMVREYIQGHDPFTFELHRRLPNLSGTPGICQERGYFLSLFFYK